MKITGKVIVVDEVREGISQNGPWRRQEIVIETIGDYPKKVALQFGNPDMCKDVKVGNIIECTISPESKEYNGKWFSNIRGISCKIIGMEKDKKNI